MIIAISVAVIALAFVVLVVYLVAALRTVKDSLLQVNRTIADLEVKLEDISRESVKLLSSTHELTDDVNRKLKRVDGFFESVSDVGSAVQQVSSSVKQVSATVTKSLTGGVNNSVHTHQKKIDDVMAVVSLVLNIWNKYKSLKSNQPKGEE